MRAHTLIWMGAVVACGAPDDAVEPIAPIDAVDTDETGTTSPQEDTGAAEDTQQPMGVLSGLVTDEMELTPVQGTVVRVWDGTVKGEPSVVTGEDGTFSFDLPVGLHTLYVEAPGDYWRFLRDIWVTTEGVSTHFEAVHDFQVVLRLEQLGRERDAERGIINFDFLGISGQGGEWATVSVDADPAITENLQHQILESDVLLPEGHSFISYTNAIAGPFEVQTGGSPGLTTCALRYPERSPWEALPLTLTNVGIDCEPIEADAVAHPEGL